MLNRKRRQINQMNVVPYIDVMLVLLVIFIVTVPLFTPGVINIPSVSRAASTTVRPLEVILDENGALSVLEHGQKVPIDSVDNLVDYLKKAQQNPDQVVAISADENLKYAKVISIVDKLNLSGIKKVALTVKQKNG